MCATDKLKNFTFVRLDQLKEKLDFDFNLSNWKLQGPDEKLPTIYHPSSSKKKKKQNESSEMLNFDSIIRETIEDSPKDQQVLLEPPKPEQSENSFVDEERFKSAMKRYEEINMITKNLKSEFKLSENRNVIKGKESSDILDMHLKNNDLNGFSEFKLDD